MLKLGLYEQLITTVISMKLSDLDREQYFIHTSALDAAEVSRYSSLSLTETIQFALNQIRDDHRPLTDISKHLGYFTNINTDTLENDPGS